MVQLNPLRTSSTEFLATALYTSIWRERIGVNKMIKEDLGIGVNKRMVKEDLGLMKTERGSYRGREERGCVEWDVWKWRREIDSVGEKGQE